MLMCVLVLVFANRKYVPGGIHCLFTPNKYPSCCCIETRPVEWSEQVCASYGIFAIVVKHDYYLKVIKITYMHTC
jgi:hypothetical protein